MTVSSVLPLVAQRLRGKVALITGAATGIGAATAKLFARHGAKVVVADIQDDLGRSLVQEIGSASYVHCDVTDESNVRDAIDSSVAQHGKLDILFSNAGIMGKPIGSILDTDADVIKQVLDVNVLGAFYCAKHAARVMVRAETKGSILFSASSVTAIVLGDVSHAYMASKNAVAGLSRSLAVELGRHGIRVNCISPHAVPTRMAIECLGLADRQEAEELFEEAGNLKGVVLREDDVAEAALYLASDGAKYVSGTNVVIDGGYSTTNIGLREAYIRNFGSKN